jgi:hypothetical protein
MMPAHPTPAPPKARPSQIGGSRQHPLAQPWLLFSITLVATLLLKLALPDQLDRWWTAVVPAFALCAWARPRPLVAFAIGFGVLFLCWAGAAAWQHSQAPILGGRMALVLKPFTSGSVGVLLLLTGLVGGLAGAMAESAAGKGLAAKVGRFPSA